MAENIINQIVINSEETIGTDLLLLSTRPYFSFVEGIRGNQEGITCTVLSEKLNFSKVNIKIPGLLQLPFDFEEGTPIPISFKGLVSKLWQDWNNKGEVKLSITAQELKPITEKRSIKLNGENK